MRMLAEEREGAFNLLRLAITDPRFDQAPVDRIRAQIVTGIIADERDPQSQGREKFAKALYGDHPYGSPSDGTVESLRTVTPEDLHALHRRLFARSNLSIAVVGAIDAETLKSELDRVFGGLPAEADLADVPQARLELDQEVIFEYPLPQASMQLVYPGIEREDPQFFAAYLMNHVLGGGTFSSRLFDEIREKRGLAYGVGSALHNSDYAQSLVIGTSTRADRAGETLGVIREEVGKMIDSGPTEDELARAKTYVIGAYPINNLDSSSAIASTLLELQKDDLGIDYIDRRSELINSITLDEAKAAAKRLLSAEPAVLIIGPQAEEEAQEEAE
jgi:zinc protease